MTEEEKKAPKKKTRVTPKGIDKTLERDGKPKNSLFEKLAQSTGNKYIDDLGSYDSEPEWYIDTGSYSLNALISASIFKGIPNNRLTTIAGEPATGKTFFALSACKNFLEMYPDGFVYYIDSEHTMTKKAFESMGGDAERFSILPCDIIEECKLQIFNLLGEYEKVKDQCKIMIVIDSVGALNSKKEMEDLASEKEVQDMTKARSIKSLFRNLNMKAGVLGVPIVAINHVFAVIGSNYPTTDMGGGRGPKFLSSNIVFLSKSRDKIVSDGEKEQIGVFVTCRAEKSRQSREGKVVKSYIRQSTGLNRYYGLVPIALKHEIFVKDGKRIKLPTDEKVFESVLYKEPKRYFTDEILNRIEEAVNDEFRYGSGSSDVLDDIEIPEEE